MASWREVCEAKILIIEDDRMTVQILDDMLSGAGYLHITATSDPGEAGALFRRVRPDLVLLDLHMGSRSGIDVLQEIHEEVEASDYLPVIVITGDSSDEAKLNALNLGAKDFITKPFDRVEAMLRIRIRIETRLRFLEMQKQVEHLQARVQMLQGQRRPGAG